MLSFFVEVNVYYDKKKGDKKLMPVKLACVTLFRIVNSILHHMHYRRHARAAKLLEVVGEYFIRL